MKLARAAVALMGAVAAAACSRESTPSPAPELPELTGLPAPLPAEGDFGAILQGALISASPGATIVMPAGTFALADPLSLDVDGVTLRGAGQGATVLDFAQQSGAGEGLLVTSDDVTLMDFTVRDTKGDGIKSEGADRITYRFLTVEWSGEPDETNGGYGIYPVGSTDVLVENVTVRGASNAGIHVLQSSNIIVRNSVIEFNVAGIGLENSTGADVYGNIARNNTGGILVSDLPDLPDLPGLNSSGGNAARIFANQILANNTRNFAPAGDIAAGLPSGTGVLIRANRNVHVFDNTFGNNRSAHVLITAYSLPFTDAAYNPLPRDILIRANTYYGGGDDPQGILTPLAELPGGVLVPIVWDGVSTWPGAAEAQSVNLTIAEAPEVGFMNIGIPSYPLDPAALAPSPDRPASTPPAEPAAIALAHAGR